MLMMEVLSSKDGGRPGDIEGVEVIGCAGDDVWCSRGSGGVESSRTLPVLMMEGVGWFLENEGRARVQVLL